MYGFRKIRRHRALRTFAHPLFQEGRTDLLPHIRRVNSMVSKVPTPSAAASIASTVALGSVAAVEISNDSLKSSVHNLNASRTISTDIEHMASPVATKQSDVETADSNSNGTTVSNTLERSVVRYGAVVGHPVSLPSGKQIVPVLNQESMYQPHMTISSDSYLTSTTASSSQQLTDDDEESYCSIY